MSWLRKSKLKVLEDDIYSLKKKVGDLELDVDGLKIRIKKKIVLPKEEKSETSKYDDGFDDVRKLS